jgi:hypothetical protein
MYSYLALPGQAVAVLVASTSRRPCCARSAGHAVRRPRAAGRHAGDPGGAGARPAVHRRAGPGPKFAPIGFALFLLSPAVVIARRLSQALNAEERSRTLEENARLREDVERMSRHDLKTPLNSILGAPACCATTPLGTGEQRELVWRAAARGYRMLEMVNLSLGLFRMETGTYDFRPQAVTCARWSRGCWWTCTRTPTPAAVTLHLGRRRPRAGVRARRRAAVLFHRRQPGEERDRGDRPGGVVTVRCSPASRWRCACTTPAKCRRTSPAASSTST